MAGAKNITVEILLKNLDHPLKREIEEVRKIILGANEAITEQVKWNAPSFCYKGDDRITFNFHKKDLIQLIFHRGARVKDNADFKFNDGTGLIEWLAKDRGVVRFKNMNEVEEKRKALSRVADQWMTETT